MTAKANRAPYLSRTNKPLKLEGGGGERKTQIKKTKRIKRQYV